MPQTCNTMPVRNSFIMKKLLLINTYKQDDIQDDIYHDKIESKDNTKIYSRIRGSKQIRVYDYQFNKKSLEQTRLLIAPAVGLEPTTS